MATYNGTCGNNLTWELDTDSGQLIISGEGEMTNWESSGSAPWYSYRNKINSVTISNGVTSIGKYAFFYCDSLTSITIPDSVTSIGNDAFQGCANLENVNIPSGIKNIPDYAFANCIRLQKIDLSAISQNYTIGKYAFQNCQWLAYIIVNKVCTSVGENAFNSCNKLGLIFYNGDDMSNPLISSLFKSINTTGNDYLKESTIITENDTIIAEGSCGEKLNWKLSRDLILTFSGEGNMYNYNNYTPYSPWYKYRGAIKEVEFNEKISSIGKYAFYECSGLTELVIPDNITKVSYAALAGTALVKMTIPFIYQYDSYSGGSYPWQPFGYMFGSAVSSGIEQYEYTSTWDKTRSDDYAIPDTLRSITISNKMQDIQKHAFYNCSMLTDITLPKNLENIGSSAFSSCSNLKNIFFPEYMIGSIGDSAFSNCDSLEKVILPQGITSIGSSAFYECESLEKVILPYGITNIAASAFQHCTSLKTVIIPNTVTTIGSQAFWNCSSLKTFIIPKSVKTIDDKAFSSATILKKIIGLSEISTITSNSPLVDDSTSIYYMNDIAHWYSLNKSLTKNNALCTVNDKTIIAGSESDGWQLDITGKLIILEDINPNNNWESFQDTPWFLYSKIIEKVEFANNSQVETIWDNAFACCDGLTEIIIPASVTSIGEQAFAHCANLKSIKIPNSVKTIGLRAFKDCINLRDITLPKNPEFIKISESVFEKCENLTSVIIPNNVKTIGNFAFKDCMYLKSLFIPNGVTTFGNSVFQDDKNFQFIIYDGSKTQLNQIVFGPNNDLQNVKFLTQEDKIIATGACGTNLTWKIDKTLQLSIVGKGDMLNWGWGKGNNALPPWHEYIGSIKSIEIGPEVTKIGNGAFYKCYSLTKVIFAQNNKIQSIGEQAFGGGNYNLIEIKIPSNVTEVGAAVFNGCKNLEKITIPFIGQTEKLELGSKNQYPFGYIFGTDEYMGGTLVNQTYYNGSNQTETVAYCIPKSLWSVIITGKGNIVQGAFQNCDKIKEIKLNDEIAYIGSHAFEGCKSLDGLDLENKLKLTSIGESAFADCIKFNGIIIPKNVTYLGKAILSQCYSLIELTIPFVGQKITEGSDSLDTTRLFGVLFKSSSGNNTTYEGTTKIVQKYNTSYSSAYYHPNSLKKVTITGGNILSYVFYGCSIIESIVLPETAVQIGEYAFYGCSNLNSITIPANVLFIGQYAFALAAPNTNSFYVNYNITQEQRAELSLDDDPDNSKHIYDNRDNIERNYPELSSLQGCGQCGVTSLSDVKWAVNINGFLSIAGNGEMKNWEQDQLPPWHESNLSQEEYNGTVNVYPYVTKVKIDYGVTNIGKFAFYQCKNLENVTIPSTMKTIGYSAFYGCSNLLGCIIPKGVTKIDFQAFEGCNALNQIEIPETVAEIGNTAFRSCNKLTAIKVLEGNAVYHDNNEGVLYGKEIKTLIAYPAGKTVKNYTILEGTEAIGTCAFYDCNKIIQKITVPASVKTIGSQAFFDCGGLKEIVLLNSGKGTSSGLTQIRENAFTSNNTNTIDYIFYCGTQESWNDITKSASENEWKSNNTQVIISQEEGIIASGSDDTGAFTWKLDWSFTLSFNSTNQSIPTYSMDTLAPWHSNKDWIRFIQLDNITNIGDYAFYQCDQVKTITLSQELKIINFGAFYKCAGLVEVIIPDNVTTIQADAFSRCTELVSVTLGRGIETIPERIFSGCVKLTEIVIPDNVTTIKADAFKDCPLTYLFIPLRVTTIENTGFTLENNPKVEYQGTEAKWNSITLNDENLKQITITFLVYATGKCGDQLTWGLDNDGTLIISGQGEMWNWNSSTERSWNEHRNLIKKIEINDEVTSIGRRAFQDFTQMSEIKFGVKVNLIDDYAFYSCNSLTGNFIIPNHITNLGQGVFAQTGIESFTVSNNHPSFSVEDGILFNKEKTVLLTCPGGKEFNEPYHISEKCFNLDPWSFAYTKIKQIVLPKGMNAINKRVFQGSLLESIFIPRTIKKIQAEAFIFNNNLKNIIYTDTEENWNKNVSCDFTNNAALKTAKYYYLWWLDKEYKYKCNLGSDDNFPFAGDLVNDPSLIIYFGDEKESNQIAWYTDDEGVTENVSTN